MKKNSFNHDFFLRIRRTNHSEAIILAWNATGNCWLLIWRLPDCEIAERGKVTAAWSTELLCGREQSTKKVLPWLKCSINWHTQGSFLCACFLWSTASLNSLVFSAPCSIAPCCLEFRGEWLTHQPKLWQEACEDGQLIRFFRELICNSTFAPELLNMKIRREGWKSEIES